MKRTKFVMIALVAALVLMGAGYAAWTQTFNITGTVETGELFVQITGGEAIMSVYDNGTYTKAEDTHPYATFTEDIKTGDTSGDDSTYSEITYNLEGMYPGTKFESTINFANIGTIPVNTVLESESITAASTLWNALTVIVNETEIEGTGDEKFDAFAEAIRAEVGILEPQQEKTVTIVMELPIGSGNETENESLTWNVDLEFAQNNR